MSDAKTSNACPRCGRSVELIRDEEGEMVPHCFCGWYGYKSMDQLGITVLADAPDSGRVPHTYTPHQKTPDSAGNTHSNSGCSRATKLLGRQSSCLDCAFRECFLVLGGLKSTEEARLALIEGLSLQEIIATLKVTKRTAERWQERLAARKAA